MQGQSETTSKPSGNRDHHRGVLAKLPKKNSSACYSARRRPQNSETRRTKHTMSVRVSSDYSFPDMSRNALLGPSLPLCWPRAILSPLRIEPRNFSRDNSAVGTTSCMRSPSDRRCALGLLLADGLRNDSSASALRPKQLDLGRRQSRPSNRSWPSVWLRDVTALVDLITLLQSYLDPAVVRNRLKGGPAGCGGPRALKPKSDGF